MMYSETSTISQSPPKETVSDDDVQRIQQGYLETKDCIREVTLSVEAQLHEHGSGFLSARPASLSKTLRDEQPSVFAAQVVTYLATLEAYLSTGDWASIGEFFACGYEDFPSDLFEALNDLLEVTTESEEQGYPTPNYVALQNAQILIRELYSLSPQAFEVYPTPDGEIAIDAHGALGSSVMVLCDSDGEILCLVNIAGNQRRARYSSALALPDGFIKEALSELEIQAA